MAHWAKIDENGIVESVIVTSNEDGDEGESWIAENLDGTWIKTSYNTKKGRHMYGGEPFRMNFAEPGGYYDATADAFVPPKREGEENFILNESTMSWIPAPFPEDADWVMVYGPDPDFINQTIQDEDGNDVVVQVPALPENPKVYYWLSDLNAWAMNPNIPAPSDDHIWNILEYEWQLPDTEKPADNFFWDAIEKQWMEIPEPPAVV